MIRRTQLLLVLAGVALAVLAIASSSSATDRSPILNIRSPLDDTVARPFVHVVAQCEDDDPRGCLQINATAVSSFCGQTPLSATVQGSSIDVYLGTCGDIDIIGTDRAGQVTTVRRRIVIESTPTLREVESVAGRILDVAADRILYLQETATEAGVLRVHDRATSADTTVPLPGGASTLSTMSFGYLSPHGVIYQYLDPALSITPRINGSRAYEWRDGTLIAFSFSRWGSLAVSGNIAAWNGGHANTDSGEYTIFIRDLAAGTTAEATLNGESGWPSVAPNGDVVFRTRRGATQDGDIARYRAGVTTALTSDPAYTFSSPVTDGTNIVAPRQLAGSVPNFPRDLVLLTSGGLVTLSSVDRGLPSYYAAAGGWTAFIKPESPTLMQTWERSPDGTTTQLTTFTNDSWPVAVAPTGEVALTSGSRLFLASAGVAPQDVASSAARPWFINGQWYFSAGRTLFTRTSMPCTFTVEPQTLRFGVYGGDGLVRVKASDSACPWGTSSPSAPWARVASGTYGSGDGQVGIRVEDQDTTGGGTYNWTVTVAGIPVTIIQNASDRTSRLNDYDGDRVADLALFRPYGGQWLVRGFAGAAQSGAPTNIPVSRLDFNRMDRGVFVPATGEWNFAIQIFSGDRFGRSGDVPVLCNYRNGFSPPAVFRPGEGRWYLKTDSSASPPFTITDWGLTGDIPVPADYDGNGLCDIAVFRPSTGVWYVRGGITTQWGAPGDIPVPADYDGDGRADIAVYRPSTGRWYVKDLFTVDYGLPGDLPSPVDVDGDGRANIAVFRRSTGTWYVEGQGAGISFGARGDIPVNLATVLRRPLNDIDGDRRRDTVVYEPGSGLWRVRRSVLNFQYDEYFSFGLSSDVRRVADFDGDGAGDLVLFRPSTGIWYVALSTTGYATYTTSEPWGIAGDEALPADYDGDGISDRTVYRPSTGRWYIRQSSDGVAQVIDWGLPGDMAVPGDYDGDGKTDVAVFRPSTGRWYAKRSSDGGMLAIDWGLSTDIPAPADFDADGKLDLAVYRPSTGAWWIRYSAAGFSTYSTITYGSSSDVPVPGDYDGDGLAEPAYFRPGSGWFALGSGLISMSSSTLDQAVRER